MSARNIRFTARFSSEIQHNPLDLCVRRIYLILSLTTNMIIFIGIRRIYLILSSLTCNLDLCVRRIYLILSHTYKHGHIDWY